jgi:hypothetical protein
MGLSFLGSDGEDYGGRFWGEQTGPNGVRRRRFPNGCTIQPAQVAEHRLLGGHHQWSVNPAHYAGLPAAVSRPPRVHLAFQGGTGLTAPEVEQRPLSVYAHLVEVSHD